MGIYRWSMKHASMVLFVISAGIFLIGFGQALLLLKDTGGDSVIGGKPISAELTSILMFLLRTFGTLSSAAIPFIGAVAINRWDALQAASPSSLSVIRR
ncbi:MAG: hypothetical protein J7500_09195 [Sphingomonas sp.]|uniref:hypothetical protein n=1 Tax=Sphingomonas sp. TaxID=28214 RepID=UPI001B2CC1B4|nr:hypothetical protein [Sphingomonas sp.]MBO9622872.1 hypothetical protein [Sphingomonas sp.]